MNSHHSNQPSTTNPMTINIPISNSKIPLSAPINIPKINRNEHIEEYNLNCNFFNPGKMSPPDGWKVRLAQRIKDYYDKE